MGKKNWKALLDMFEKETDLKEKYEALYLLIANINKSIDLSDELDKLNKDIQEMNKED